MGILILCSIGPIGLGSLRIGAETTVAEFASAVIAYNTGFEAGRDGGQAPALGLKINVLQGYSLSAA